MLHRTEGIVIKTREYGDADLIVTFLTNDFGLIHSFAKSPRKTKSRFGSSLEPLSYVRLSFWGKENARLPRLTQADIIKSFQTIRESYDRFVKVSELLEIILMCFPERDVSHNAFGFFLRSLHECESEYMNPLMLLALKIKLLKFAGFAPKLNSCARCGEPGQGFHFREGSIMCGNCSITPETMQSLSPGAIKLYDCLSKWTIEKIYRVRHNEILVKELNSVMNAHVKYYISRDKKSFETAGKV